MDHNGNFSSNRSEHFRATKIWNTIVSAVKQNMPLGRHRRGLKLFENCFPGSEAVSWTLDFLKNNRNLLPNGQEVTRQKVVLLMQKFVEQKIIHDVRGRSEDFKDSSSHLYAFCNENIPPVNNTTKAAFKSRSSSLGHITPPMKCATSIVKSALVGLSYQKVRRESSSLVAT
ncbi:DEP domain-containing protein 1B [Galendromus occidentalis]|uniref:DEP domain-containing protein 1B n=1 Tax=Galendromus occidentalis TaxID=34638 RepID=A0AAJ6QSJ0_9ACAR|nr:DEP domain-containing protein 1B [Galendromus occidentalis]